MEFSIEVTGLMETEKLAKTLTNYIMEGTVILLSGDLGAGKTTFTQFMGMYLGVKRRMSSPTFNIIKSYQGKFTVHHMDCYRLEDSDEDMGFDEYFNGEDVAIIEWPEFIQDFLPSEHLDINIEYVSEDVRRYHFKAFGEHYIKLLEDLEDDYAND
ncbi:tRNA (adenosine(37)-N6)-threonylcarbamoyltransferase complex ATPase subunit type 1 TsaE [Salinicoccus sp. CNSTN-B1]